MATKKSAAEAATKAPYEVISPLCHGVLDAATKTSTDTRYEIGDHLELTEAEAAPLLGHTVKAAKAAKAAKADEA